MRGLLALVIAMGVLIVAGVVTLAMAIVGRSASAPPLAPMTLDEPAGAHITALAAAPGYVALQLQGGGPDRVVVFDLRSGRIVARVGLAR